MSQMSLKEKADVAAGQKIKGTSRDATLFGYGPSKQKAASNVCGPKKKHGRSRAGSWKRYMRGGCYVQSGGGPGYDAG